MVIYIVLKISAWVIIYIVLKIWHGSIIEYTKDINMGHLARTKDIGVGHLSSTKDFGMGHLSTVYY